MPKTAVAVQLLLDGYTAAYGELENISLGGARLTLGQSLPASQDVELRLTAEEQVAFSFHSTAKVVWCQPATSADGRAHWGVRWTHFPRTARHVLEAMIAATCAQAQPMG